MNTATAPTRLDPAKRDILREVLGLDKPRQTDRNLYSSEPGYEGHELVLEMVRDGLMHKGAEIHKDFHYYHVTDAGKAAVIASAGQDFGTGAFK